MKRILNIIIVTIIIMGFNLPATAEDNWVDVKKSDDALNIYAKCIGSGKTLEDAKLDAINKILPQIISKTHDVPGSYQNHMIEDGVETAEGIDMIAGKTFIQSYWKLEDGKYIYKMELLISPLDQ